MFESVWWVIVHLHEPLVFVAALLFLALWLVEQDDRRTVEDELAALRTLYQRPRVITMGNAYDREHKAGHNPTTWVVDETMHLEPWQSERLRHWTDDVVVPSQREASL